jgi:hypothetical protein
MNLGFSQQILEKYSYIKFHENPSVGAELLHTEGRTEVQRDMTKVTVTFRSFANAPKNVTLVSFRAVT